MPPFQTDYSEMAEAYAGMIADGGIDRRYDSYLQGEASAEMRFGIFVAEGAEGTLLGTPRKAILMVDANSVPAGLVIHSHTYAKPLELGDTGLKPKVPVTVMKRGRAWAICETALAVDAIPFIRFAAGTGTIIGALNATADTATCLKFRGCRVVKASSAAGVVQVEFDCEALERAVRGLTGY